REMSGRGIQRNQSAIECAHVDAALPDSRSLVGWSAAGMPYGCAQHMRVIPPQLLSSRGIDRMHEVPNSGRIQHAIDNQWRCLGANPAIDLQIPREPELADIVVVDLL